ncbi:hypothetical protein F6455_03325 [Proteobacteria bacterium 005FR1]|nr:hypothetical protein [Proteobacteria bacterium 005FR1]
MHPIASCARTLLTMTVVALMPLALAENPTPPEAVDYGSAKPPPDDPGDGSRVALKGTVVALRAGSFILDHGDGTISIEMDNWANQDVDGAIREGQHVTVRGKVDNDFWHRRRVEADSVHVEELQTTLTAPSPADEEEAQNQRLTSSYGPIPNDIEVAGTVTSVRGDKFTIDNGRRRITVDTSFLDKNPMDDSGYQQIDVGDFVRASGDLGERAMDERVIAAKSVIVIE